MVALNRGPQEAGEVLPWPATAKEGDRDTGSVLGAMPRTVRGWRDVHRRGRGESHDLRTVCRARHLDRHVDHDGLLHGAVPGVAGTGQGPGVVTTQGARIRASRRD